MLSKNIINYKMYKKLNYRKFPVFIRLMTAVVSYVVVEQNG